MAKARFAPAASGDKGDKPNKNKPGRPPNIDNAQRTFIMQGYSVYRSLRLAKQPQKTITDCINHHAANYISFFGADGSFRRGAKVADAEEEGEGEEWIDTEEGLSPADVAGATQSSDAPAPAVLTISADTARNLKQDKLVIAVRKVCCFFSSAWLERSNVLHRR